MNVCYDLSWSGNPCQKESEERKGFGLKTQPFSSLTLFQRDGGYCPFFIFDIPFLLHNSKVLFAIRLNVHDLSSIPLGILFFVD